MPTSPPNKALALRCGPTSRVEPQVRRHHHPTSPTGCGLRTAATRAARSCSATSSATRWRRSTRPASSQHRSRGVVPPRRHVRRHWRARHGRPRPRRYVGRNGRRRCRTRANRLSALRPPRLQPTARVAHASQQHAWRHRAAHGPGHSLGHGGPADERVPRVRFTGSRDGLRYRRPQSDHLLIHHVLPHRSKIATTRCSVSLCGSCRRSRLPPAPGQKKRRLATNRSTLRDSRFGDGSHQLRRPRGDCSDSTARRLRRQVTGRSGWPLGARRVSPARRSAGRVMSRAT